MKAVDLAKRLQDFNVEQREAWLDQHIDDYQARLHDWPFWARDAQLPPKGNWRIWLVLAGRGFGKTRAGAEWVRQLAEDNGALRIALVGANIGDARAVMVEGESGLLAIAPPSKRPVWEPSLRRLRWPSGAQAFLYSAEEPDQLRGPQHHYAWCDELAKWAYAEDVWSNLLFGLRLGDDPRTMVTTTPRPVPIIKKLMADRTVTITRGKTDDNRANLPTTFMEAISSAYGGTRLGRQELDGELIEEAEGALWSRDMIERCRTQEDVVYRRVVIGVDPPAGTSGDACGIIVAALAEDGRVYVLEDASVQGMHPEGWARTVAEAAARWQVDRIIAEANNGGAMVESVLRAADCTMAVKRVHASRGKVARAEPVASLYARGKVMHRGAFPALEDEMCGLLMGGAYVGPGRSPDRADALVWAIYELMLAHAPGTPAIRMV